MKAGVIGLGSMGGGAAISLVRAGIETRGTDLREEIRQRFADAGGIAVLSADDVARDSDVILVFVVNADQVEQVLFGGGAAVAAARTGTVFILCATIPPVAAEAFGARLAECGMGMIDAPVSGGAAKAEIGAMTMMISGVPETIDKAEPVLSAISERIFRLGDAPGAGSRMKMVNQHLAGIHIAAAAEALTLAIGLGLDPHEVIEVIRECAGTSWMFENRGPHIADGDYAPLSAVDIFVKDLGIVVGQGEALSFDPVLAQAALTQFRAASEMGLGREDDSAVAKTYAKQSGISLPGDDK